MPSGVDFIDNYTDIACGRNIDPQDATIEKAVKFVQGLIDAPDLDIGERGQIKDLLSSLESSITQASDQSQIFNPISKRR